MPEGGREGRADWDGDLIRPPAVPLAGAAVAVVVAAAALVPATRSAHVVGYATGMIGSILLAFAYQAIDRRRSQNAMYSRSTRMGTASKLLLGIGLVLGVVHIIYLSVQAGA